MDSDAGGYYPPDGGGHHLIVFCLLLLFILAIGGGGGWAGHYTAGRGHLSRRAAARKAIYKSVRRAINRALRARDADLAAAARDLTRVASQRLGPLAETGKPLFSAMEAVNKALAGKMLDTPKPPAEPKRPEPVEDKATESATGGTVLYKPSVNFNFGGHHDSERKSETPPPPPAPPKPVERDMTVPEQRAELTKAIEAFDRAWQPDRVEAFLSAAQAALLDATDDDADEGRDH